MGWKGRVERLGPFSFSIAVSVRVRYKTLLYYQVFLPPLTAPKSSTAFRSRALSRRLLRGKGAGEVFMARPLRGIAEWPPERWISFSAALISLSALLLAFYTAYLNRDYLRRSQHPEMLTAFYYNQTGSGFRWGNIGLGPARIEWFQILVDDQPHKNWSEKLVRLGLRGETYSFFVPASVSTPGSMTQIFWLQPGTADEKLRAQYTRIALKTCYCSIFDECWIAQNRAPGPRKVPTCQPFPKVRFGGRELPEDSSP